MALPRFIASTPIQPGPIVSTASVFDKLAKTFGSVVTATGARIGAQVGENLGFKPTLAITPATKAFNQAGLQANKYAVAADITVHSQDLLDEFGTNVNGPESLQAYQKTYQQYANDLLNTVPVENRGMTRNLLINQGMRGAAKISKKLQAQSTAEGLGNFYSAYSSFYNEMSNTARQPSAASQQSALGYYGTISNLLSDARNTGMISAKTEVDLRLKAQKEIQRQNVYGQYQATPDKLKFIQNFAKSNKYDKAFSAPEKDVITKSLISFNKTQGRIDGINQVDIDNQLDDLKLQAKEGISVNPQELTNVVNWDPTKEKNIATQLNQEAQIGVTTRQFQHDSLGNIQQQIASLSEPLSKKEAAKPGAAQLVAMRTVIANNLTRTLRETLKDPAQAAFEDPAVQDKIQTWENENPFRGPEDQATYQMKRNQAVQSIIVNNLKTRGFAEGKIHAISNANALQFIGQINKGGFEDGLNILGALRQESGPNWKYAYQSLIANGLSQKMQMAVGLQRIPASEVNLGAVQQSFDLKQSDISKLIPANIQSSIKANFDANSRIQTAFDSLNAGKTQNLPQQAALRQSILNLAYVLYEQGDANGRGKDDPAGAVNSSFNILYGNRFSEINQNYRVPLAVDGSEVRAMIKAQNARMNLLDFKALKGANPALSKHFIKATDLQDAIRKGKWVSDPTDQNRWTRVAVDGRVVNLENGQPWAFTTKDLLNPQILQAVKTEQLREEALRPSPLGNLEEAIGLPDTNTILNLFRRTELQQ
jgi:hypothetical protein